MAISTNGTVLARLAGALYNTQMSNATYNEVKALDPASLADALYARDFSSSTDAAVATTLVTNLGLTSVAGLVNWIAAQLTAAGSHKGAKIVDLLNGFAQMSSDATYGAYATAFNAKVDAALLLSQTTGNAGGTFVAAGTTGSTFTLTTGFDVLTGTAGNDTFAGTLSTTGGNTPTANGTISTLDTIDGGAGVNTLNISDVSGGQVLPAAFSATNIQTVNIVSAGKVGTSTGAPLDITGLKSVTALNATRSYDNVFLKAGDGQTVVVSGTAAAAEVNVVASTAPVTVTATGKTTVAGGSTQTVTTKGGYVLSGATDAIVVTDAAQGAIASSIDDGTSVTLTSTAKAAGATTGTITIGAAGTAAPTGAITVTSNISGAAAAATNTAGGAIGVTGGTTVSVTQNATQAAMATASTNSTITQAAVTVTGKATTTAVTVANSAAVAAANTVLAATAVTETSTASFGVLKSGDALAIGGLTFTAGSDLTAAQVAAAFANLTKGAVAGNSTKGTYSGAFSGWTSGAVTDTSKVTFTSTAAGNVTDAASTLINTSGNSVNATLVKVDGVAAATAAGAGGVTANSISIADVNYLSTTKAGTITSIAASNYTSLTINDNALTTLSATGGSGNIIIDNGGLTTATNKTLNLTLNGSTAGTLDDADIYTTLNVATTGVKSTLDNITFGAATALNVSGTMGLTLTSASGLSALKTVTVTGSAGLTASVAQSTVTSVDTSGTTGNSTITLDSTKATFAGGTGAETVTTSAGISKAISLGAGNDSLTIASGVTSVTAAVSGGDGTDTLSMVAADAVTASANILFAGNVTGFEILKLTGGTGAQSVAVNTLGSYHSVSTGGEANGGVLTLTGLSAGDTLTLTSSATGTGAYAVAGVGTAWTDGTADAFNVVLSSAGSIDAGTVTANKIETINVTATDTDTTSANADTVTVAGDTATAIVVSGNAPLTLTSTAALVTSVNATAATGAFAFTASGTAATTVTGSATAANTLAAKTGGTTADVLIGGAGADKLTANAGLDTLTGGAGKDTFVVAVASANANVYSTITDATSGDAIQLADKGTESFATTKLSLGDTATFQNYLDLAAAGDAHTNGIISWFQYAGNTYIVEDIESSASTTFEAGTDIVVKLSGLIDLSTAALNTGSTPTLLLG